MTNESPGVAQARERVERARSRLWRTVDEIIDFADRQKRRLEPSQIARGAWEGAKSKGADLAEDAVDAVRKRPVAATGALAAVAMFIAREPLMDLAGKLVSGKSKKKNKGRTKAKPGPKAKVETRNE